MKGLCKAKMLDKALQLWGRLRDLGVHRDDAFYNNLLGGCAKAGRVDTAFEVLGVALAESVSIPCATLNALMDACVAAGRLDQGWQLLEQLQNGGVAPDNLTFCILVKAIKQPSHKADLARAL